MTAYSCAELRTLFLEYFTEKGHTRVPSSPLIPANDPTLLFTNAGMVQFKEAFLGLEDRGYTRATSSQRCVRAGGKHNDLENVGYTARHHTFFEMLGNFSFGDYFKREAIQFAWDFLTKVLCLPEEKLWVTVYTDDDEAADIWLKELKVSPDRFSRCGEQDNFWSMGDTGPCGPCSEIFYDHGADIAGGPPGSPEQEGDRYIEIWNLVFMQYERDTQGKLTPLPKPSVDTGMGLERLAAVMQGVHNNYDIDLFVHLLKAASKLAGGVAQDNTSLRVIADHIRSTAFLITDGVAPSNEGRGYVLRRIIRRAVRHGHSLGITDSFMHKMVAPLVECMGEAYPELATAQAAIEKTLLKEETQFAKTLSQGLKLLEQDIAALQGALIPGATVFKLYDTYGFPVDLTADIARERALTLDIAGFEAEMERQRAQSQAASQFKVQHTEQLEVEGETEFTGYEFAEAHASVVALFDENGTTEQLQAGQHGLVVLEKTPFYAESGGQVGDKGLLLAQGVCFKVSDTQAHGKVIVHHGELTEGELSVGASVEAKIDVIHRQAIRLNHSATHLLHAALRHVLGGHVLQKGSLVDAARLRFDFSHFEATGADKLREIEFLVNQQIRFNHNAQTELMTPEEATQSGALALFGEKYGEKVRVLQLGNFSQELCGGTHVARTGDIGLFKITLETGIAAGVRRIEAVTGEAALAWMSQAETRLTKAASLLKTSEAQLIPRLEQQLQTTRDLEKQIEQLKSKLAGQAVSSLTDNAQTVKGVNVLAEVIEGGEPKALRQMLDQFKQKLQSAVIVLACVQGDKVSVIAGVTPDLTDRAKAGELVNFVAQQVGGKGGGRADMAQAGGSEPNKLPAAMGSVADWVAERF